MDEIIKNIENNEILDSPQKDALIASYLYLISLEILAYTKEKNINIENCNPQTSFEDFLEKNNLNLDNEEELKQRINKINLQFNL